MGFMNSFDCLNLFAIETFRLTSCHSFLTSFSRSWPPAVGGGAAIKGGGEP
jgi:hypothetical protein